MTQKEPIKFPVVSITENYSTGGLAPSSNEQMRSGSVRVSEVTPEDISKSLKSLISAVNAEDLMKQNDSGLSLSEIKINLGFSASGKLSFIVAKGDVKASSSIELVFKK